MDGLQGWSPARRGFDPDPANWAALDGFLYNRQLHPDEGDLIVKNAARYAALRGYCASESDCSQVAINRAIGELTLQAVKQTDQTGSHIEQNDTAANFLAGISPQGLIPAICATGDPNCGQTWFTASGDQYRDASINSEYSKSLANLYLAATDDYNNNHSTQHNIGYDLTQASQLSASTNQANAKTERWMNGWEVIAGIFAGAAGPLAPREISSVRDSARPDVVRGLDITGQDTVVLPEISVTAGESVIPGPLSPTNIALAAQYTNVLRTTELANPLVESLRTTGKLPANYMTKSQALAAGWVAGKAVGSTISGGQIGGDIYRNTKKLLPDATGRIWYEADIGLSSSVSRSKQTGLRLLYSSDGLMYVTFDHYDTVNYIGRY